MMDLAELVELENDDPEMVPEILPVDARISIRGPVEALAPMFARAAAVAVAGPEKEMIAGTSDILVEAVQAQKSTVAYVRGTSSDGEKTVSVAVDDVTVLMEGAALLPARRMNDILKLAPGASVRIEVIGNQATVRSGRALWTLQVSAGDALAVHLDTSGVRTAPIEVKSFGEALSVARRAASTSDARDSLMQIDLRNSTFTACDGGRVHRQRVPGVPPTMSVTIPVKAVDEILKAVRATTEEHAEFGYDERHVVFETSTDRIVAQRLLIPFPEAVESLILAPAFTNVDRLRVNRVDLMDSVRRVRINSNPDSAAITLAVVPHKGDWTLSIRAKDLARNSSQETIDCAWHGTGRPAELMVNHHYLMDLLESHPVEDVFFKLGPSSKSQRAPLFVEDEETGFVGVVQQMYAQR